MPTIINGTDNTAATPALTGTDTDTGVFFPAANTMAFSTGGTEQVRIDSSGNVGIGNSNPASYDAKLLVAGNLALASTTNKLYLYYISASNNSNISTATDGAITFVTGTSSPAERMRVTPDGRLLVGNTSGGSATAGTVGAVGFLTKAGNSAGFGVNTFNIDWTGTPQLYIDTTNIGTIAFTSDYRIKRNVETQTAPALERVMALRPVTYQMADYGTLFKADNNIKEGFIAHEVQEVIPSGAEGVKDAENQIQSLRVDAILAVAIKAIQELKATVDAQAARIAALEAKE
jgi:hypothetical protein